MTRLEQKLAKATKQAATWNANHPVGTVVRYYPIISERSRFHITKTRSEAWVLPSGMPMVLLDGQSGGIWLDALEPYKEESSPK